jgi:hypothetical protein
MFRQYLLKKSGYPWRKSRNVNLNKNRFDYGKWLFGQVCSTQSWGHLHPTMY